MRLRSVWISQYKNLRDFRIGFDSEGLIDIFVGKNGSGKSNFLEALIEIFDHLFDFDPDEAGPGFDYAIGFEIGGAETTVAWRNASLIINGDAGRRALGQTPMPDHVVVYYSGHNPNVGDLISKYKEKFERKIDGPGFSNSPKVIHVTGDLKDLLLAMMLVLPDAHAGRQVLMKRLGIRRVLPDIRLELQRPIYARGRNAGQYNVDDVQGDKFWKPRGATKDFLDRLEGCLSPPPQRGRLRTEGYQEQTDAYFLYLDLEKVRVEFAADGVCSLFRQFYSLKILEMLSTISVEVELESGFSGGTSGFSDGQFQMVYMLATAELFRDRNILSFFDEPDAFLHPEWQFDFLKQINAISDQAARTNHILLNSHSASTIAADTQGRIRLFTTGANGVSVEAPDKATIVSSLSAGLITFSETEASLNIERFLANTSRSVLFTEGVTDAEILTVAWNKLFPEIAAPFEIAQCFDCGHLRKQMGREELYQGNPGRTFFALFDFDHAYGDWAAVGRIRPATILQGRLEENDITRGLVCKRDNHPGYAMMLPVPNDLSVRSQVCNVNTGRSFGDASRLTIELLFRDVPGLESHFAADPEHPAAWQRFIGDKVHFAQQIIPNLNAKYFEAFRPIFDFIQAKVGAD